MMNSENSEKETQSASDNVAEKFPSLPQNPQKSNKQVELGFCLEEKGPKAAKRFNDLIAKTLKLQE